jgi:hypothetical protein
VTAQAKERRVHQLQHFGGHADITTDDVTHPLQGALRILDGIEHFEIERWQAGQRLHACYQPLECGIGKQRTECTGPRYREL